MNAIFLPLLLVVCAAAASAQGLLQLRGQVTDPSKASIPGAMVSISGADGVAKASSTDEQGRYSVANLTPGKYLLQVSSAGFESFSRRVELTGDRPINFDVALKLAAEAQQVTVADTSEVALDPSDPSRNVGALVLKGEDLQMLSDNPEDLAICKHWPARLPDRMADRSSLMDSPADVFRRRNRFARCASTPIRFPRSTTNPDSDASRSSRSRERTSTAVRRSSTFPTRSSIRETPSRRSDLRISSASSEAT